MKETKSWRSLLTVVMLLGGWLMAQAATSYGITVGGVPVTSDNASNITGSTISGKVSYNATTHRLTLKDANITYTSGYGIGNNGCEGLEIYIDGMCSVKGTFALNCNATTTIKGKYPETLNGQSVDLIGTISPVYVANDKTLTFSHVMVSTTGSTSSGAIRGGGKAALAFTKSTVFIDANESDPCVSGFTSCTMTECEAFDPTGAFFSSGKKAFCTKNGIVKQYLRLYYTEESYGIYVAGREINNITRQGLYDEHISGEVTYDRTNNVLTLDGVSGDCQGMFPALYITEDAKADRMTIYVTGNNTFTNAPLFGILTYKKNITFDGDGSLSMPNGSFSLVNSQSDIMNTDMIVIEGNGTYSFKNIEASYFTMGGIRINGLPIINLEGDENGTIHNLHMIIGRERVYGKPQTMVTLPNGAVGEAFDSDYSLRTPDGKKNIIGQMIFKPVTDYMMKVADVDVTSANSNDVLNDLGFDGKASYNPSQHVLTIDNLQVYPDFENGYLVAAISTQKGAPEMKLRIKGSNAIGGESLLLLQSPVAVDGSEGSLSIDNIIVLGADLVLNDCNLTANGIRSDVDQGDMLPAVSVNHSNITLQGRGANVPTVEGLLQFEGSDMVFLEPAGAVFNTLSHQVELNGAAVKGKVVVGYAGGTMTSIDGANGLQPQVNAIYDTAGRRLKGMGAGLNVVRMSDGTVKKVVTK